MQRGDKAAIGATLKVKGDQWGSKGTSTRPRYFGMLTNDIVYARLAPGVLDELKRAMPKDEKGRKKGKYFQLLTKNFGYPKLREHLGSVVTMMKLSNDWPSF